MSELWFCIKSWSQTARISEEEFQKSTENFLVRDGGQKVAKSTKYSEYYQSWDEAHKALLSRAEADLVQARRALERAQGFHGNIVGMKKP